MDNYLFFYLKVSFLRYFQRILTFPSHFHIRVEQEINTLLSKLFFMVMILIWINSKLSEIDRIGFNLSIRVCLDEKS